MARLKWRQMPIGLQKRANYVCHYHTPPKPKEYFANALDAARPRIVRKRAECCTCTTNFISDGDDPVRCKRLGWHCSASELAHWRHCSLPSAIHEDVFTSACCFPACWDRPASRWLAVIHVLSGAPVDGAEAPGVGINAPPSDPAAGCCEAGTAAAWGSAAGSCAATAPVGGAGAAAAGTAGGVAAGGGGVAGLLGGIRLDRPASALAAAATTSMAPPPGCSPGAGLLLALPTATAEDGAPDGASTSAAAADGSFGGVAAASACSWYCVVSAAASCPSAAAAVAAAAAAAAAVSGAGGSGDESASPLAAPPLLPLLEASAAGVCCIDG